VGAILALMALPASAVAQSRTWVSGVGDDANPCSRTAPCKTFAGAISKTDTGGEIDALDPGGFGALTITKSITITSSGQTAGVLVAGTNGITINAAGATVVLKRLDIDGLAADGQTSPSGVQVQQAASVTIENSDIYGFTNGIGFEPTTANTKLIVDNSSIHGNTGDGVLAAPGTGGSGAALLTNDYIDFDECGIAASSIGLQASPNYATDCGTNATGASVTAVQVSSQSTSISDNTAQGILSNGSGAGNSIGRDLIIGNGTGLQALNGGFILSLGGSDVFGNTTEGGPTAVDPLESGPAGPAGATGATGSQGATGPAGAQGAAGEVELVSCKRVKVTVKVHGKKRKVFKQKCTGKLVSGTLKFTTTGAVKVVKASISRAGRIYAAGSATVARTGTNLALTSAKPLSEGFYTLTLSHGRRVIARRTVVVV
jgi:hypothetical protein